MLFLSTVEFNEQSIGGSGEKAANSLYSWYMSCESKLIYYYVGNRIQWIAIEVHSHLYIQNSASMTWYLMLFDNYFCKQMIVGIIYKMEFLCFQGNL